MARHFPTPDDAGRRGGDESYHAPAGNVHAAGTPTTSSGYLPVTSEPTEGRHRRHDRRQQNSPYVQTDPYDLHDRRKKKRRGRAARVVSAILVVVGLALLATAAYLWWSSRSAYAEQDSVNEQLATYVTLEGTTETAPEVDWEGLKAVNSEVVGWVQIPGTVVDFPVYQASDNEKYLHTNAYGEYSVGGQIFMDFENTAPGMLDAQTLVYGHHLRNGAMFKPISDMANQEMFDSVSTIWYVTEDATYELEPLLLYQTEETDTAARTLNFESDEARVAYLDDLLARSQTSASDAAEKIATATHVLTLCTCNYDEGESGRTLLVCSIKAADADAFADAEADGTATGSVETS